MDKKRASIEFKYTLFLKFSLGIWGIFLLFPHFSVYAQDSLQIVFYNAENFFDVDAQEGNNEYALPNWSENRYSKKVARVSQAILASNSFKYPEIIALAEIENKTVINDLLNSSLFKKYNYKVIHQDSRDRRGMDVALMLDTTQLKLYHQEFIQVQIDSSLFSRDILYAKLGWNKEIVHLFVNHWPSRYLGASKSNYKRLIASMILKQKCDSIYKASDDANIVIVGDFNDEPGDKSVKRLISKNGISEDVCLKTVPATGKVEGTIKYQGRWYLFDQFLISNSLMEASNKIYSNSFYQVCTLPFLLEQDEKYTGEKPFRTYLGHKYQGGYSDHLPIKLTIYCKE